MSNHANDARVVMTLDAGGTSFRFSALRGNKPVTARLVMPSCADDLERCLGNLVVGFTRIKEQCPAPPVAISFAFPGPADYPAGVIGDLPNLPAFRNGVALGPMLEERFGIPVFINNDGGLFVYGEAVAGFLPYVNALLSEAASPRRYRHLFGVTLGTGFGGGLVIDGRLHTGDNSVAGGVWLMRNKLQPELAAEQGACIRAVRGVYAAQAGIALDMAPDPETIFEVGMGRMPGNVLAAREAFRQLGEVAGDAIAQALTLIDAVAVIGGGISAAWPLFLPTLVRELNGPYVAPSGHRVRRLSPVVLNLEDPEERRQFVAWSPRDVAVPHSGRLMRHDPHQRLAVGISRLGTSEAIAVGAYTFALENLDRAAS